LGFLLTPDLFLVQISSKSRRHERTIFLPSGPMGPEGKKPILTAKSLLFYQNKTYKFSAAASTICVLIFRSFPAAFRALRILRRIFFSSGSSLRLP